MNKEEVRKQIRAIIKALQTSPPVEQSTNEAVDRIMEIEGLAIIDEDATHPQRDMKGDLTNRISDFANAVWLRCCVEFVAAGWRKVIPLKESK